MSRATLHTKESAQNRLWTAASELFIKQTLDGCYCTKYKFDPQEMIVQHDAFASS